MRIDDGVVSPLSGHRTEIERDAFVTAYLEAKDRDVPFFGVLAFNDAHAPWSLPPPRLMPPDYEPPQRFRDREAFEAEVIALDHALGYVLSHVDPDAWIFLLGDNGTPEEVAPNADRGKHSVFEGGVRVPFYVAGPGLEPRVSPALVHVADVFPTIADALGLPTPALEEESFVGALCGGRGRLWTYVQNPGQNLRAAITRRWKLVDADGVETLYDLGSDPREEHPLPAVGRRATILRSILAQVP